MSSVQLDWTEANDDVAVDHYNIYRRVDGAPWGNPPVPLDISATTSYTDSTVTADHTYEYIVTAEDASGNESFYSNNAFAFTGASSDVASAPQNLHLVGRTATSMRIGWNPPSSIPVSIAFYLVQRDGEPHATLTGDASDFNDTGMAPQESHTYQVLAVSPSGLSSPPSSSGTFACLADTVPPTPPANLVLTAPTPTSVVLDWQASTDNVGVTDYVIARNGSLAHLTLAPTTIWTDSGRSPNTSYTYEILARDAAGNLSTTTSATITTPTVSTGSNVYNVPTTIDRTGTTDVTESLVAWLSTVPDGGSATNRNIINFPSTDGVTNGPATYRCEDILIFMQRNNWDVKGNGARIIAKTNGAWVAGGFSHTAGGWFSRGWPLRRINVLVRACHNVRITNLTVLGANYPGNFAFVSDTTPITGLRFYSLLTSSVSASQTTMDVDYSLTHLPADKKYGWSTSFGLPYWLVIGDGPAANFEVVRVTAETPITGGFRLTIQRGQSQPWGKPGTAWPSGTRIHAGKVGGGAFPGAYDPAVEGQSGFEILGVNGDLNAGTNCSLDNCHSLYALGSAYRVSEDANHTTLTNCEAGWAGRQSLTPDACSDLLVDNMDMHDSGFSHVDIEPAANASRVRDLTVQNSRMHTANGVWVGFGGRGRGPTTDGSGRPNVDNVRFIDNVCNQPIQVRGDVSGTPDGPRGRFTMLRNTGGQVWGSPVELVKLYRCKGVTIQGHVQKIATTQNRNPFSLNAHCTAYNSAGQEVECLTANDTPNPACRTDNGGSLGRRANQVPAIDNDLPGATSDWNGQLAGYFE